jgi:hypothetical protein
VKRRENPKEKNSPSIVRKWPQNEIGLKAHKQTQKKNRKFKITIGLILITKNEHRFAEATTFSIHIWIDHRTHTVTYIGKKL